MSDRECGIGDSYEFELPTEVCAEHPPGHRLLPVRPDPVHAGPAERVIEWGVAPADIQYEVLGPDLWQADLD